MSIFIFDGVLSKFNFISLRLLTGIATLTHLATHLTTRGGQGKGGRDTHLVIAIEISGPLGTIPTQLWQVKYDAEGLVKKETQMRRKMDQGTLFGKPFSP